MSLTPAQVTASLGLLRRRGRAPSDPSYGYSSREKAEQVQQAAQTEGMATQIRKVPRKDEWAVYHTRQCGEGG